MRFTQGDRVRLTRDRSFSDGTTIPAGTAGTVERVFELEKDYRVDFGRYGSRKVLDRYLERG